VTLESTFLLILASSTDLAERTFISIAEARALHPNTRVFRFTPTNEEINGPAQFIYCDNDKGTVGRTSCPVAIYQGHWRELEYNPSRQQFEVKGHLEWLHDWDTNTTPVPTIEDEASSETPTIDEPTNTF
jgi:hypothetical protein